MNGERVGDIVLHGNDAIRFAYMLYHPTEEELLYNRSVLERIDNNITIMERDNGYDAEIKDLDLSFLEEKPQCSLDNIEVTWTINIQKEEFFYPGEWESSFQTGPGDGRWRPPSRGRSLLYARNTS